MTGHEWHILLKFWFQTFCPIDCDLKHLVLDLRSRAHLLDDLMIVRSRETLRKFCLLLRSSAIFLKHDHHFAEIGIFLVYGWLSTHFDDFANLVLWLADILIQTATTILLIIWFWHRCVLLNVILGLEDGCRTRACWALLISLKTLP